MADGEVKIHAVATADLAQIEEAQKKIKELYQHAAAYESKGMTTAAASARADARAHEKDIARFTRERSQAEKAITKEMREQTAERKAGIRGPGARQIAALGQNIVQGGPEAVGGNLMSMGMGAGHPALMVAAIAAAVGTAIATTVARERDKDTAQAMGIQQRAFAGSYQLGRQAGIFGSSRELVSSAVAATDEIEQRKSMRGEIAERARVKWYDPLSWTWGGLRKNEGQREEELNEAAIQQKEREREVATKGAQKKFIAEEGGLELRALRGRSARTLEGSQEAFKAELAAEGLAKYKQILKDSGDKGMAMEMMDLTVNNKLRELQASAGAGLVDARSGGAGVAAAAAWATQAFPDMVSEMKALHATVQAQANPLEKQSK